MSGVNIWAVLVAAVSSFLLGGLWYSPVLFHKVWNREAGRGENPEKVRHPGRVFGVAFVFALIAAWVFAWWLGPDPQLRELMQQALSRSGASLQAGKRGAIVIKSISARQRPRRPKKK